jgi:transposase, IS30 family
MPRYAWNKSPTAVKARYFELIRQGWSGSRASAAVGVSLSCGSLWFVDAGSVSYVDTPISGRYLSQDDRIEIADGLARGESVKSIAGRIGKTHQSVYREIARNRKPDGHYQPWFAHNQAHLRRRRPKPHRFAADISCAGSSPPSWPRDGRRRRSPGGCGDVGLGADTGMCATRRSTRRSIGA